jgi:hypothetical protein
MRLSIDVSSGKLLVSDVDETQEACGRDLLGRLATRASTLSGEESVSVDIDWATLRLRANSRLVVAEEPDYLRDPKHFVPSLSITCLIFVAQQRLLRMLHVNDQPVKARQYARVSRDAIQAVSVVGYRHKEVEAPFTGWQVVSTMPPQERIWGLYSIRELTAQRLVWLVAMNLPTGWAFRFAGNTLMECVSPEGVTHELNFSVDW